MVRFAACLQRSMRKPERKSGGFIPFPLPGNLAMKPGRENPGRTAEQESGTPEHTIRKPILHLGEQAIPPADPTGMAPRDWATTCTATAFSHSMRIQAS